MNHHGLRTSSGSTPALRSRATAGAAALAVLLAGCGGGSGNEEDNASPTSPTTAEASPDAAGPAPKFEFSIDDSATGPAPEVEGAVQGGTITVLEHDDVTHLDPARIYVNNFQNASQLIARTLTGFRQHDGKVDLVGDLATNTGKTTDGGKTWTFTLRDGIAYEDGSPIVAADLKYGIERGFHPDYTEGPTYLQEWLADTTEFRDVYKGPYGGKSLDAISAPDEKTLVLKFRHAHPDLPFAATLPLASPVPERKDTKAKYDLKPFASGPYKISEHKPDKSLVLVRNDKWKPETDPLRYQFADSYSFEFGPQPLQINQRLIASRGKDAAGVPGLVNISSEVLDEVADSPELQARTISGFTPFVSQYYINNKRITDIEVRKALLFAFPKQQVRLVTGGPSSGDFATSISSPTLVGHEPFDLYDVPPKGDPERARETLEKAGKLGQKIVYAYRQTDEQEKAAIAVADALQKAGFEVVKKPLNSKSWFDDIGEVDNPYDLYEGGWGSDWPSGSTVFPVTMDSRRIADGSANSAMFDDPAIDKEMDRILKITDAVEAGKEWTALDRKIMEQVPQVPFVYTKANQLYGPKIGGAFLDQILGLISLNGLYVKK